MAGGHVLRRLVTAPFGAAADVMAQLVDQAKAGDPLAPVTVACPSSYAGVALRRSLGGRPGGVVNVRFLTLPEIAEQLAGPRLAREGRAPVTPTARRAAVRAELRADPGPFEVGAGHAATEEALDRAVATLDMLPAGVVDRVAESGPVAHHAVRLYRGVGRRLGTRYGAGQAVAVAAAVVRTDPAATEATGPVLVHLPRRLSPAEVDLVAALAAASGAAAVVGVAEPGDSVATALVDALEPVLGEPCALPMPAPLPAEGTVLVSAADPDEEVRDAVRHILRRVEAGVPLHRCAVLWRLAEPYALVVRGQLAAAGLAFHGPAPVRLSQSVAGRTLLGALDLAGDGMKRVDVFAWLAGAPVLAADGRPVPAARWERLARRAGIVGGVEQWHERLGALAAAVERELDDLSAEDPVRPARERDRDEIERLGAFVDQLASALVEPDAAGWAKLATWAAGLLERYLGTPGARGDWPEAEVTAHEQLLEALQRLAGLDAVAPCHDVPEFRRAFELETEAPSPSTGFFGGGVFTGSVADALGGSFDTVAIVGMVEGAFPPEPARDAVLDERARAAAGGLLPRRAEHRSDERLDFLAAIAAGRHRVLCHARSDPRGQRRALPARWFLEAAGALAGRHVPSAAVDDLATQPWYWFSPSFVAATAGADVALSPSELDVRGLLAGPADPAAVAAHPVAAADPRLAKGLDATYRRRAVEAGRWSGFVGDLAGLAPSARPRSPTSLESYARCPFRYFMRDVLRVGELDEPDAAESITPADKGSLVHEILERFVRDSGPRPPDQAWDDGDRARLHAVADGVLTHYETAGRTGRALLWRAEQSKIRRDLDQFLVEDSSYRRAKGVVPAELELRFGFEEGDAVGVTVAGGLELAFHGYADRVDVSPDGSRVVVLDYKTGSANDYRDLATDIVCGGRHLQLPVYALAAESRHPGAELEAYFWFTSSSGRFRFAGGRIDPAARRRFHDVLSVMVDGIGHGRFPTRPGKRNEWANSWDQCRYCPYDRVCPGDRHRRWERFREDPSLADYLDLVGEAVDQAPDRGAS